MYFAKSVILQFNLDCFVYEEFDTETS